MMMIIK